MRKVYIEIGEISGEHVQVPIESGIVLLTLHFLQYPKEIQLCLVPSQNDFPTLQVSLAGMDYKIVDEISTPSRMCQMPVLSQDEFSCVAGLCAVLRQITKLSNFKELLGFRGGCLVACAEFSMWTRFCEVDLTLAARKVLAQDVKTFPLVLAQLESHLKQPIRVHNIGKLQNTSHTYVEGPQFLLSDIIIAISVFILLESLQMWEAPIPLTLRWMSLVMVEHNLKEMLARITRLPTLTLIDQSIPQVEQVSLYKSDPKRYKARDKIFTQQCDIDESLAKVSGVPLIPFQPSFEEESDEEFLPQPDVPKERLIRKKQQLVNLMRAAKTIVQPGSRIVDFCSGSGHLGIILAHKCPKSEVYLLDNKEVSLDRARDKVNLLGLRNVFIIQANLDYFVGTFKLGVSLHACGVASDLVIQKCLRARASFIVCPCCYGGIQSNHMVSYPQSKEMQDAGLSEKNHLVLGHCADQAGTEQGERAMQVIDSDRCLAAQKEGYQVSLYKLEPPSCTTRNNLIVAVLS